MPNRARGSGRGTNGPTDDLHLGTFRGEPDSAPQEVFDLASTMQCPAQLHDNVCAPHPGRTRRRVPCPSQGPRGRRAPGLDQAHPLPLRGGARGLPCVRHRGEDQWLISINHWCKRTRAGEPGAIPASETGRGAFTLDGLRHSSRRGCSPTAALSWPRSTRWALLGLGPSEHVRPPRAPGGERGGTTAPGLWPRCRRPQPRRRPILG